MTNRISAHGLAVTVPAGWHGAITRSLARSASTDEARGGSVNPVLHVATFPLPAIRGDFGGDFLAGMGPDDLFIALVEYDPGSARTELFSQVGPAAIKAEGFSRQNMHRPLPGQSGHQQFFHQGDRAFCLYVAIGSHRRRQQLSGAAALVGSSLGISPG